LFWGGFDRPSAPAERARFGDRTKRRGCSVAPVCQDWHARATEHKEGAARRIFAARLKSCPDTNLIVVPTTFVALHARLMPGAEALRAQFPVLEAGDFTPLDSVACTTSLRAGSILLRRTPGLFLRVALPEVFEGFGEGLEFAGVVDVAGVFSRRRIGSGSVWRPGRRPFFRWRGPVRACRRA